MVAISYGWSAIGCTSGICAPWHREVVYKAETKQMSCLRHSNDTEEKYIHT